MDNVKIILVGLGPHAKRIYMKCFEVNHMEPTLIVDLESKKSEIEEYINTRNLSTEVLFIDSAERNALELSIENQNKIIENVRRLGVTHAIISTEPKAHYAYIKFFLKNGIHVLVDKPLTAPVDVSLDEKMAKKIKEEYDDIKNLYCEARENNVILQVQCQRRWHKGYQLIYQLAEETVKKYNIPITAIQITHCDGMWNMPDEFVTRENHPYKYGYGKLFHSGYHFVDLAAWFESINYSLERKASDNVELYATAVRPSDFVQMVDKKNYQQLFNDHKFDDIFDHIEDYNFDRYGEIDLYSLIQFKRQEKVISTVTLNLMQNGFSRRSWNSIPEDTYKGNGRVRHEYMNLEIGPLMNIQVHSYQSKEIKDKVEGNIGVGEVEHFDIFVYRNIDLIGGVPMEKFTLNDLYKEDGNMQGYNEEAREHCFDEFIRCEVSGDPIFEHELGIQILTKEYEALCQKEKGLPSVVQFPFQWKRG